nr:hypothetical protein [Tanacetum cinerariifolium]
MSYGSLSEEVVAEVVLPTPTSSSPPSPVIPSSPPHQPPCPPQLQDAEVPSLLFQRVLDTCSALARRVEGLKNDKAAQQLEIVKLKAKVKKLEKINLVKSSKLRQLKKDEGIELVADQEKDVEDYSLKVLSMQKDDTEVQEAVEIVTTAKLMTKVVTAAATQAVAATKRRKLSEEAQEADDLRKRLEIVEDEDDDVFVEATLLAQKVPVVDY